MADTRQRILDIASALFADRGYAATSLADIAERLGTSKAALYYHFRSKAAILDALVAAPLAAYGEVAGSAKDQSAPDLLAAVIDATIASRAMFTLIDNDPSVRTHLDATRAASTELNATIVAALARHAGGSATRAHAAYAIAKHATIAILEAGDDTARQDLLDAATRALGPDAVAPGP